MHKAYERQLVDETEGKYHVTDMEGNVSKYKLYQGHKYSARQISGNVSKRLDEIANMSCRDDDILLSVYPKSGTHWLTNIVTMVVRGNTEYVGTPPLIGYIDMDPLKYMESPRIFGTHLPFECFPNGFKEGKTKIITISRHPKDVMASMYSFCKELPKESGIYRGNWKGYFNFHMNKEREIGDWKNWFTVAQSEIFDEMYEKELDGNDISEVYNPE